MTNEWLEFKAYTDKPTYFSLGKRDFSYLGRFSLKTILELEGLGRILTIIARGYLFHNKDGNILKDDAYTRVDYVRNALCAWCSVPNTKENPSLMSANSLKKLLGKHKDFTKMWTNKVKQMQIPRFEWCSR